MPRVLIIDDEPGIRFALRRWFERQGYGVLEAGDGAQALAQVQAVQPDDPIAVVVCDLNLPDISGDALMPQLVAAEPRLAERVVLTTGDSIDYAPKGSLLATHPFVLQKPFDLSSLKVLVEQVMHGG